MTIDWTKPIETMNGFPARVLATDFSYSRPVVVAVATKGAVYETVWLLTNEGAYAQGRLPVIRNVPPECASPGRIACVRVEFKEGQFDD